MSLRHPSSPSGAWRMVCGLGVAQIVWWGSLFYAIGVLAPAIAADLELSRTGVFGAYSLGMLVSGFVAPSIGRGIDRDGGRRWLARGSIVAALALLAIAASRSPASFYAAWLFAGVAMAMTLYDPAFVTLAQHFGTNYRSAVTVLTLFGGLASTVFWPLSLLGLDSVGWRATLVAYAALELALCLPLHRLLVPSRPRNAGLSPREQGHADVPPADSPGGRRSAIATAFALNAFIAGALAAHMPAVLEAAGLTPAQAVLAGAVIGPMQVAGRLLEFGVGRNVRATTVGRFALALLLAILLHPSFYPAFAFATLYGVANGIITIVRGTAPAELFGRREYGALLGRIAKPTFIAKAIAPVGFALMVAPFAAAGAVALMLLLALASLGCFIAASRPRRVSDET